MPQLHPVEDGIFQEGLHQELGDPLASGLLAALKFHLKPVVVPELLDLRREIIRQITG